LRSRKVLRKLIPQIANFFCLGSVLKIRDADGANANFIITTSRGRFFVKINLEPHTRDNKLLETAYVAHLLVQGIPVVPYLPGNDGTSICRIDDIMAMSQKVAPGSNPDITIANVSQIGKFLGKLHLVPTSSLPYRYGWLSPEYIQKNLVRFASDGGFRGHPDARKILSVYGSCDEFVRDIVPKLPASIVHSDLHSENVLFKNGQLTAVVDWEDSTIAPSLFDFVSSAAYWCFDFDRGTMRPKLYRAFRESYEKERPLTKLEIEHLRDCMRYVEVVQTMWRFLNYPNRERHRALWGLMVCN